MPSQEDDGLMMATNVDRGPDGQDSNGASTNDNQDPNERVPDTQTKNANQDLNERVPDLQSNNDDQAPNERVPDTQSENDDQNPNEQDPEGKPVIEDQGLTEQLGDGNSANDLNRTHDDLIDPPFYADQPMADVSLDQDMRPQTPHASESASQTRENCGGLAPAGDAETERENSPLHDRSQSETDARHTEGYKKTTEAIEPQPQDYDHQGTCAGNDITDDMVFGDDFDFQKLLDEAVAPYDNIAKGDKERTSLAGPSTAVTDEMRLEDIPQQNLDSDSERTNAADQLAATTDALDHSEEVPYIPALGSPCQDSPGHTSHVGADVNTEQPSHVAHDSDPLLPPMSELKSTSFNLGNSLLGRKKPAVSGLGTDEDLFATAQAPPDKLAPHPTQPVQDDEMLEESRVAQDSEAAQQNATDEVISDIAPPAPIETGATSDFEAFKAEYERKREQGEASLEDEVNYLRMERKENERKREAELQAIYDANEEDEEEDQGPLEHEAPDMVPEYVPLFELEATKPAKRPRKTGKRKLVELYDDEILDNDEDWMMHADAAPLKRAKNGFDDLSEPFLSSKPKSRGRRKKDPNTASTSQAGKSKPKKATARKKKGPEMTNLSTMINNDIFRDVEQTRNLGAQPTFTAHSRRDEAMKNLMASIPDDRRQEAKGDKIALDDAIKKLTGQGVCSSADNGEWKVKGMKSTLKSYQIMGVSFMRQRETALDEPRGGILADQMGLGKTVQMLCNIVNGAKLEQKPGRATLIVAAPAICRQWWQEIIKHCEMNDENKKHGLRSVGLYMSGERPNDVDRLQDCSIVLTTYYDVSKSFPKPGDVPPELTTPEQQDEWWQEYFLTNKGILHQCKWHRVVLDEAHQIKNHMSHTSMACTALEAKHKWAITGTPVMNTIKEFYAYFKFLNVPHTGSLKTFKHNFCSGKDQDGMNRLHVFLNQIMIRRTHGDTMFNAKLLELPDPSQQTMWVDFSPFERQVYDIVKARMVKRMNAISASDLSPEKKYTTVLSLLLRLRQLCSHCFLVQDLIIDVVEDEDYAKLKKLAEEHDSFEGQAMHRLFTKVDKTSQGKKDVTITHEDRLGQLSDAAVPKSDDISDMYSNTIGVAACIQNIGERWTTGSNKKSSKCGNCQEKPRQAKITSCGHIYCASCLRSMLLINSGRGRDYCSCKICGKEFDDCNDLPDDEPTAHSTKQAKMNSAQGAMAKGKGARGDGSMDWMACAALSSAKTTAARVRIKRWLQEDPTVKIIVFAQFMPVLRLLGTICELEGWDHCMYTGAMSQGARERSIDCLRDDPQTRIMLASLKCGGLGLNLTMASKVICLDPWWNSAVEQQAFCRVFRIGQDKNAEMLRIIVNDTIDSSMMAMKDRKDVEIDNAMEGRRGRVHSLEELYKLFGDVEIDGNGNPFIFPTDDGDQRTRLPTRGHEDSSTFRRT